MSEKFSPIDSQYRPVQNLSDIPEASTAADRLMELALLHNLSEVHYSTYEGIYLEISTNEEGEATEAPDPITEETRAEILSLVEMFRSQANNLLRVVNPKKDDATGLVLSFVTGYSDMSVNGYESQWHFDYDSDFALVSFGNVASTYIIHGMVDPHRFFTEVNEESYYTGHSINQEAIEEGIKDGTLQAVKVPDGMLHNLRERCIHKKGPDQNDSLRMLLNFL